MKHGTLLAAAFLFVTLVSTSPFAHGHGWAVRIPYYYPYYYPYYGYYPYSVYPAYPPPPVVLQRYYVRPAPEPPQYRYEERQELSQAQVIPPQPARPAPRMERITLSAQELFGFDEATLRSPQPRLDEIADLMVRNPEIDRVTITGYTDRIGTASYNLRLSQRRAEAVKRYLVAKGVGANRLVAVGKGKANPVVQCSDKKMADLIKCLAPNRRVEVEQITVERRVR